LETINGAASLIDGGLRGLLLFDSSTKETWRWKKRLFYCQRAKSLKEDQCGVVLFNIALNKLNSILFILEGRGYTKNLQLPMEQGELSA
jgi:hypothetical protein